MVKDLKEVVKQKYTEVVSKEDGCGCNTSCCSPTEDVTFSESYSKIDGYSEEADYGLGCGIPTEFAQIKAGDTVLDLGSGAGNDAFVARRIVGDSGLVIGVDMTEAMIAKANENKRKLNYSNVDFILGEIENLPVGDQLVDVVVSNCVLNLVPDKSKAFQEIHRVLKPNSHFSISDIVLNGSLPKGIRDAAELYANCISGALPKVEYLKTIEESGFVNVEVAKERQIDLPDHLLAHFISQADIDEYRKSQSAILSITVYGEKK